MQSIFLRFLPNFGKTMLIVIIVVSGVPYGIYTVSVIYAPTNFSVKQE